jgi:hypothetical protein
VAWEAGILDFTAHDNIVVTACQGECLLERYSNVSAVTQPGVAPVSRRGAPGEFELRVRPHA